MYIPSVDAFFYNTDNDGGVRHKTLQDILARALPVQEEFAVNENDISEPFRIRHDMRLNFEEGAIDGVLTVHGRDGKHSSAIRVPIPDKVRQKFAGVNTKKGRFRKHYRQRIQLPAMPSADEAPTMYSVAEQSLLIREFSIICMGEKIGGTVYREWWKINVDNEKNAELVRMELGRGISSRFLKNTPRLRLD